MNSMQQYQQKLTAAMQLLPQDAIDRFFNEVLSAWKKGAQVFVCGNGGSAANAMHMVNDLFYGAAKGQGKGLRAHTLGANQPITTCLANDVSYEAIFSGQLEVLADPGDLLIVLSGSGNSANVLNALRQAGEMGVTSVALLGYAGGAALELADIPVHVPVDDMQIAEDLQLIIGHALMQWLHEHNPRGIDIEAEWAKY